MRFDVFDFYGLMLRLRLTQCLEGHVDMFRLLVRDGIVDPRNGALVVFPNDCWRKNIVFAVVVFGALLIPNSGVRKKAN